MADSVPHPNPPPADSISANPARSVQRGDLVVDFGKHTITVAGKKLDLSATEFELLAYLARAAPEVVSAQDLATHAQGYSGQSLQEANATLRYHFYRIRRKIKKATGRDDLIKTVHGIGYTLLERAPAEMPSGAITFLLTDIQDSTALWEQFADEMKAALVQHDTLLRRTIQAHDGHVFKRAGDMFCAAFASPLDAANAAVAAQRALHAEDWATPVPLRVHMALHTGIAELRDGDYFGVTINQVARMVTIGHGGQILLSGTVQEQLVRHRPEGAQLYALGTRRLKGIKEPVKLYQLSVNDLPGRFPPLKTLDARTSNLPAPLTSFVGREWDTRQVMERLRRPNLRLLTLTGMGGAGKTRLALHVAAAMVDEFQDGVFFAPLAAIQQPDFVAPALLRALGLEQLASRTAAGQLSDYLSTRQVLLVIDNFEHVLDAAPLVTDLLRAAPNLQVLATSREALHLYGEHLYPVSPLTTPDLRNVYSPAQLEQFEAPKLFIERAHAILPHLTLTHADAQVIAEICACLDGLPLAIELAAARMGEFSLTELAAQLTTRLGFLSRGARDLPARHQTLRGLLDWSYHLLNDSEQALFARLAVPAGGWTVEAALAIATWPGDEHDIQQATHDALANKFLIQSAPGTPDQPRMTMLETLREYARERLDASGEKQIVQQRHAEYYTRILQTAEPELIGGARQKYALWMCDAEQDNFRAALEWALETGDTVLALKMTRTLWRFWGISSALTEGRNWIKRVLAASADAEPGLVAPVRYGESKLALFQADYAAAEASATAALALYQTLGDADGTGWCLNALGEIEANREDARRAEYLIEDGLALHRQVNNKLGIAKGLDDLGRLAMQAGQYERAAELLQASLQLRRERASPEGIAVGLLALGEVKRLQGDYAAAEKHTHESLARYRQLNHTAGVITCLYNLAQLRQRQSDSDHAIALYLEALGLLRELEYDETELVLDCLAGLSEALLLAGEVYPAALAIGAHERLWLETRGKGWELPTAHLDAVRTILRESDWARATDSGRVMSLDEFLGAVSKRK